MRILKYLVLCVLTCFAISSANADATDPVNSLLDSIAKAHETHDISLLSAQYSDGCALFVGESPSFEHGAFVLGKEQVLAAVKDQVWPVAGLVGRKTTDRRIAVRDGLAFIRMTVTDLFKDGKSSSSEQFAIATKEASSWKVCFSLPALAESEWVVTKVEPGSAVEKAGLKSGDMIAACDGEPLDALVVGADIKAAMKAAAKQTVTLAVSRAGASTHIQIPAALGGATVQATLVPSRSASFVAAAEPHPVRELLRAEVESIRTGNLTAYGASICSLGFFSYRRGPGTETNLVTKNGAMEMIVNQNSQSRKALDPSTVKLVETNVIATSNIALGTATVDATDRAGKPMRVWTRLHVYMRKGTQWFLVADLVERFRLGPGGSKVELRSVEETRKAKRQMEGKLVGIGVKLKEDPDGAMIGDVLPDTPAENAGLLSGEIIVSVDGSPVKGMPIKDVVGMITGEEGSKVTLEIAGQNTERRKVELTRAVMMLQTVKPKTLGDAMGYLQIDTFDSQTAKAVRSALGSTLAPDKTRGIVLDLRGTAGGLYPQVVEVARQLIRGKKKMVLWIVRQKDKEPVSVEVWPTTGAPYRYVVVVDAKTSGSAELLAEALRQCSGAILVGAKTAGGAMMRELIDNPDGTSRVVQIGDFLFPKTGKTGTDGVVPDIAAPNDASREQVLEMGRDALAKLIAE